MRSTVFAVLILSLFAFRAEAQWNLVSSENSSLPRHENAFVKAGKKFYLLGGRGIKPVEIYDPATKSWTQGATTPVEMSHFQAIEFQGLIFVLGGFSGGWPFETPLPNIFIYDPSHDRWIVGPRIPEDRQRGAAGVAVYSDKIYLVCGIVNGHTSGWVPWLDEFDPKTNTWRVLPDAPRSRDHLQAAVVENKLVVAGGRKSGYQGQGFQATVAETDVYDFESGKWSTLPSPQGDIPTQRAGSTAMTIGNEVWVIGGESGSQQKAHSEVEALDIANGTWRKLPNLQTGRHGTQMLSFEGSVYIGSGCGNRGGSPELNSLESFALASAPSSQEVALTPSRLVLSDTAFDYGKLRPFSTRTQSFQIQNTGGNQGIPITFMVVTGDPQFTVEFPHDLPYVLAPGAKVDFQINYSPQKTGASQAELFIKPLDGGKISPLSLLLKGG